MLGSPVVGRQWSAAAFIVGLVMGNNSPTCDSARMEGAQAGLFAKMAELMLFSHGAWSVIPRSPVQRVPCVACL